MIQFIKKGGEDNSPIEVTTSYTTFAQPDCGYIGRFIEELGKVKITKAGCNQLFREFQKLKTVTIEFTEKPSVMKGMFSSCVNLESVNFINLDASNVTDMSSMFNLCRKLITAPTMDTSNVTDMSGIFNGCSLLQIVPTYNLNSATTIKQMFNYCTNLTTISLLNTNNVTSMDGTFYGCTNLTTIPVLNTSSVTDMYDTFGGCSSLSEESLNNILSMCIGATSYIKTKTLKYIGLTSTQATTCQGLSNYQSFLDAGWTTGY